MESNTNDIIKVIESVKSPYKLHKLREMMESYHKEINDDEVFYSARTNGYVTIFDVISSDGLKIGEFSYQGNCATVTDDIQETYKLNFNDEYEVIIKKIDDRIIQAEKDEKKSSWRTVLWFICFFVVFYGLELIALAIKHYIIT